VSPPSSPSLGDALFSETQERFLRDAAQRLPLDRVVELHLFPPIRQGGAETGIAIIAVEHAAVAGGPPQREDATTDEVDPYRSDVAGSDRLPPDADASGDAAGEVPVDAPADPAAAGPAAPTRRSTAERLTVFSARYRLTLKGPDRGRWEVEVVEEADAPLVSVDAVVRGVQRRAGEGAAAERLSAEQLRTLVGETTAAAAPPGSPR